jgi:hypothetical protein
LPITVLVSIRDNGTGISEEDITQLFKRFSLGKGRKPAGTGLGLYYCSRIIKLHNGFIWVESTAGRGSEFKFILPLKEVNMKEKTIKILIVDDSKLTILGLKNTFNYCDDMKVIGVAENGKIAVSIAQELKPDIIVMDIGMPVMDGIQATKKLKNIDF